MNAGAVLLSAREAQQLRQAQVIRWEGAAINGSNAPQLAQIIRENHRLEQLHLRSPLDDDAAQILAEAIGNHPSLHHFHVAGQRLQQQSVVALAEAALGLAQLESLQLRDVGLEEESICHIATQAQKHPALHSLCLSKNPIKDTALEAVADLLGSRNQWQRLRLMDCQLDDAGMQRLVGRLQHQPCLTRLHLHHNPEAAQAAEILEQAAIESGSLNLLSVIPPTPAGEARCKENRYAAQQTLQKLSVALDSEQSAAVVTNLEAIERLPAILQLSRLDPEQARHIQDYIAQLPEVDSNTPALAEQLLAPVNGLGQCAAENPATWQQPERLLQALERQGQEITTAWLQHTTPQGETLLACALACNAADTVAALNRRGMHIRADILLDGEGKPSAALENLRRRNSLHTVFGKENWQGADLQELRQVIHALPPEERQHIPNRYQLEQMLRQEPLRQVPGR